MSSEEAYSSAQVSSLKLKSGKDAKLKNKKKNRAKEALETAEASVARDAGGESGGDTRTDAQKAFDKIQVSSDVIDAYFPTSARKNQDISSILAGHSIFAKVLSPEKRDNSTFWNVFAGHYFQHMYEKARRPAKNGTVGKYVSLVKLERLAIEGRLL